MVCADRRWRCERGCWAVILLAAAVSVHSLAHLVHCKTSQDHVLDRIKHFAVVFAQELVPGITQQQLDLAFSRALYSISAQDSSGHAQLELKFNHNCRWACRIHCLGSCALHIAAALCLAWHDGVTMCCSC
jgi:hypothetical protein